MKRKSEIEIESAINILSSCAQHFENLERFWPPSKRGSNAQRCLDQLKEGVKVTRQCCDDALAKESEVE